MCIFTVNKATNKIDCTNFGEKYFAFCLIPINLCIIIGIVLTIAGYPYRWVDGQCYVVDIQIENIDNNLGNSVRGKWCVDYKSEDKYPLIQNTNFSVGADDPSAPFCIDFEDFITDTNVLNSHPINSTSPCKIKPLDIPGDIVNAKHIVWMENWSTDSLIAGIVLSSFAGFYYLIPLCSFLCIATFSTFEKSRSKPTFEKSRNIVQQKRIKKRSLLEKVNQKLATFPKVDQQLVNSGKVECSICLDKLPIYAPSECGHLCFCQDCVIKITNSTCPICRGVFDPDKIIRIYY